ncbi:MAG: hypothetical protein ABSG43_12460 [Solirubrobacteraceae bacterium]|jgi:hypothetical protein
MCLIEHNHIKPWAALAGPDRAYLRPELDALPYDDPDKRWVLAKCEYAMALEQQQLTRKRWWDDAPYRDADAEAYARRRLMPAKLFRVGGDLPDDVQARIYGVPVDKVSDRRTELHAEQDRTRPGRLCAELEPRPARPAADDPEHRHRRHARRRVPRR